MFTNAASSVAMYQVAHVVFVSAIPKLSQKKLDEKIMIQERCFEKPSDLMMPPGSVFLHRQPAEPGHKWCIHCWGAAEYLQW